MDYLVRHHLRVPGQARRRQGRCQINSAVIRELHQARSRALRIHHDDSASVRWNIEQPSAAVLYVKRRRRLCLSCRAAVRCRH
jgi:hypothetical protein